MKTASTDQLRKSNREEFLWVALDKIPPDEMQKVRQNLQTSPFIKMGVLSLDRSGILASFRVNPDKRKVRESYEAVRKHVRDLTGMEIGPRITPPREHDDFLTYSRNPKIIPISFQNQATKVAHHDDSRLDPESCISATLHPYDPASLHHKNGQILENIKSARDAVAGLATDHPKLASLYQRFIEARLRLHTHKGPNEFLWYAIPFLYRVVGTKGIMPIVNCFVGCNRGLFGASPAKFEDLAKPILKTMADLYLDRLSFEERQVYRHLEDDIQEAYRICRDLAMLQKPDRPLGQFFLSSNELGDRLEIHPQQAQRIMQQLEGYGLIRTLEKGTRRAPGVSGRATLYCWNVPVPCNK